MCEQEDFAVNMKTLQEAQDLPCSIVHGAQPVRRAPHAEVPPRAGPGSTHGASAATLHEASRASDDRGATSSAPSPPALGEVEEENARVAHRETVVSWPSAIKNWKPKQVLVTRLLVSYRPWQINPKKTPLAPFI